MEKKTTSRFRQFINLPIELVQNRTLIGNLAKNDFKTRFAGSYLGVIWAFVQPIVTVVVYWFVFTVGLRQGRPSGHPFVLWLMAGLVPWFFFSEALNGGTNALIEYNYLVKKVVFNIDILPLVKVLSAIFVHVIFTAFTIVLCWCNGYIPSVYLLQNILYDLSLPACVRIGVFYICGGCFFSGSDTDCKYCITDWNVDDSNYVEYIGYFGEPSNFSKSI